jgi:hypothetical protein
MSIQVSPETEGRLAEAARQQGISVDELLDRFLGEAPTFAAPVGDVLGLPVWKLGEVASMRRRDLYDDVD